MVSSNILYSLLFGFSLLFVSTGSYYFLDSFFGDHSYSYSVGRSIDAKILQGSRVRHWARYSFFSLLYIYHFALSKLRYMRNMNCGR